LQTLQNIIVSFKRNQRIITKTTNNYQRYDNTGKKSFCKQTKGDSWAVRKSLHKDTVFGEVNLRKEKTVSLNQAIKNPNSIVNKDFKKKVIELLKEGHDAKYIKKYLGENKDVWSDVNVDKIEIYYFTKDEKKRNGEPKERYFATRKPLDNTFDEKKIESSVTDTGIQKILLAHLKSKDNNPEQAFSPDGIEEMNRNIVALNNGKFHQPILKVRVYEKADKFAIGQTGNKTKKFVEAAKGTNLFWAILGGKKRNKETGKDEVVRSYLTIPLNIMIEYQKKYSAKCDDKLEQYLKERELIPSEYNILFILSPNDLVYLPNKGDSDININTIDKNRIYKFIDTNSDKGNFVPFTVAKTIFSTKFSDQKKLGINIPIQDEYGRGSQGSKSPRAITGEMIKETCVPIKVDRLGNIIELNGIKL
jgi:CRISPR-associated endonuclease Csn1